MLRPMSAGKFPKRNYAPRARGVKQQPPRKGERAGFPKGDAARQRLGTQPPRKQVNLKPVAPPAAPAAPVPAAETAWEAQAQWYDQRQGEGGDDFHSVLVLPAVLRQLAAKPGDTVLDVCCGQGVLGRALAAHGVASLGVDASPSLVAAAGKRASPLERHRVGDARSLADVLGAERFDHAALVMALQDLDPLAPVLAGVAAALKPGGRCAIVLTHPCFRIPRRTSWGWDEEWGIQYRRCDAYLSPASLPIRTHPGKVADSRSTTTFHRPLSTYLNALGAAGMAVIAAEELCSHRRGTNGPRASAEDRAAREFPVFIVLTAVKPG